ncbi:MAG TPA: hypothetical protein VE687_13550, partial [Stellaceae bacterium]|nr:hypothetical protein [Stellaceae bacterium]
MISLGFPQRNSSRYDDGSQPILLEPSFKEKLMTLAERLDTIRQGADKRIPPDKRAIMHRATADLRASGIMAGVIKVGDPLPPVALKNAFGHE